MTVAPIATTASTMRTVASWAVSALHRSSDVVHHRILRPAYFRNEIAPANVDTGRHPRRRCADIEVVHRDAVAFDIPDEPCVFFLFNPFERYVLDQVVDNIRASHERNPRPMYVEYHNTVYAAAFEETGLFEEVWSRKRSRRSECHEVIGYRTRDAAAAADRDDTMLQVDDDLRGGR
ncbi:hypothetical protein [Ilumatobacter sp.]|uniref:hypothetical protein n=1 Tax=Ilumatobacter sp. TaxID=1967498 RepID=UPI003AF4899F